MPLTPFPPGLQLDRPPLSAAPYYRSGYNVRFRGGLLETVGLHGKVREATGDAPITLPGAQVRALFVTPSTIEGQILGASVDTVSLLDFDPGSLPGTGTRWRTHDVTPGTYTAPSDVVTTPSSGRVAIPPVWWFFDTEDTVIGQPSNVLNMPCYSWDRDRANNFEPITNSPTGAVGGGIIGRILVLLGCTSLTDPDPTRFMVIRWSDRFDWTQWTPADTNLSGELLLEGGSRIVGGGVIGGGVIAWTDKRMALLTETGDPDSVFARRYIDGGRGLLCNRGWCEADGTVWWMDETRTLNRWDGGRPRQIQNPIRIGTIERADDALLARAYMVPNPEFGEVIFWYPDPDDPDDELWIGLVYCYLENVWSIWRFDRPAWGARVGVIRNIAADSANNLFFHDLDATLPNAYLPLLGEFSTLPAQTGLPVVEPYDWGIETGLMTTGDPNQSTLRATRTLLDHLPIGIGTQGASDEYTLSMTAYGTASLVSPGTFVDSKSIARGQVADDLRLQGKAVRLTAIGLQHRTVWRFGQADFTTARGGQRT